MGDKMRIRKETETIEFKKSTSELKEAIISIVSMLNKYGNGKVLFGIKPNGDVVKNQVSESTLRDVSRKIYESIEPRIYPIVETVIIDDVEVIEVNVTGTEQPYSAFGRYYIRTADEDRELGTNELKRILENQSYKESWEQQLTEYGIKDVDQKSLKAFYDTSIKSGRLQDDEYTPERILTKLGLYKNNQLTNAGYVMFSDKSPVTLKMAIFATDEKLTFLDINTVEDNIFNLIQTAQIYVEKNIRWTAEIIDFTRVELPEIPTEALREIIVNSFAHAQYSSNSNHEIRIHPSKIVIYSPGAFNNEYSPKDYIESNLPSIIRNETITRVLYMCKAIEQFGSGFKRVDSLCEDFNVEYTYKMLKTGFEFTFLRQRIDNNMEAKPKKVVERVKEGALSQGAITTLNLLRENPSYTRDDLAKIMSKHVRTIQRYLDELSDNGYVMRVGAKKKGIWEIIN